MFTGIIQAVGEVAALEARSGDLSLKIHTGKLDLSDVTIGDSIAVNGVCLTVIDLPGLSFWADVSAETSARTVIKSFNTGRRVNLEKALMLNSRLGGHLVSGHIDGIGKIIARRALGRSLQFTISAAAGLARYIAEKGSICVDGVSLTVNRVTGVQFELNIVPHTLVATTINEYNIGQEVNLEVDIIARYLERLLLGDRAAADAYTGVTKELLAKAGFIN